MMKIDPGLVMAVTGTAAAAVWTALSAVRSFTSGLR